VRLILTRNLFSDETTLGILSIVYGGEEAERPFGFTCEDQDRGLEQDDPAGCAAGKVPKETAIPAGVYRVRRTWSPRYQRDMPEVLEVPAFRGIRIHSGNSDDDTEGCILPGLGVDPVNWLVTRSRRAAAWLDQEIGACESRGEPVTLEVRRDPAAWAAYRGTA